MAVKQDDRDWQVFLNVFPIHFQKVIDYHINDLIEVIVDYNRPLEIRTTKETVRYTDFKVRFEDLNYILNRIDSPFSPSDRACLDGTLHRISRILNLKEDVIGLTCRRGTPFIGSVKLFEDLLAENKSILLIGPPARGKTSKIRDIARHLSTNLKKRVIVVDSDNEIAGGGDSPHESLGYARRMMVPDYKTQADVMVAAIENHMPDVLICDELSTREDAEAVLTAARRGVTCIATAHGNTLEDVLFNPMLKKLLGNVTSVTLSDDEAQRRGTAKTVLERESTPAFDIVIELYSFDEIGIHHCAEEAVDTILSSGIVKPEVRQLIDGVPKMTRASSLALPMPPITVKQKKR